ncbi:MAG: TrmB family transcriptional regulator [Candidatus Heimdallarchaeaceae archaeon]
METSSFSFSKEKAIYALISLGLPKWEAITYVTLYGLGPTLASNVAKLANIPQPKIYTYLNNLVTKSFVTRQVKEGKPDTFSAVPYEIILETLQSKINSQINFATKYFEETKKFQRTRNVEDLFSYYEGEKASFAGLKKAIDELEENIFLLYVNPKEKDLINNLLLERRKTKPNLKIYTLKIEGKIKKVPPLRKLRRSSNFEELVINGPTIFYTDFELQTAVSKSLNLLLPSIDDFPSAFLDIRHPVAIHFQLLLIRGILEITKQSGVEIVES